MFKELYDVLPPNGQLALTVVIVIIGGFAAWKGLSDNKKKIDGKNDTNIPMFVMMGPVHDALQSIHSMAEESRTQTATLKDIDKTLERMDRGQQYTHYVLEALLRDEQLDPRYRRRG